MQSFWFFRCNRLGSAEYQTVPPTYSNETVFRIFFGILLKAEFWLFFLCCRCRGRKPKRATASAATVNQRRSMPKAALITYVIIAFGCFNDDAVRPLFGHGRAIVSICNVGYLITVFIGKEIVNHIVGVKWGCQRGGSSLNISYYTHTDFIIPVRNNFFNTPSIRNKTAIRATNKHELFYIIRQSKPKFITNPRCYF